jgi:hypothetical protein
MSFNNHCEERKSGGDMRQLGEDMNQYESICHGACMLLVRLFANSSLTGSSLSLYDNVRTSHHISVRILDNSFAAG